LGVLLDHDEFVTRLAQLGRRGQAGHAGTDDEYLEPGPWPGPIGLLAAVNPGPEATLVVNQLDEFIVHRLTHGDRHDPLDQRVTGFGRGESLSRGEQAPQAEPQ